MSNPVKLNIRDFAYDVSTDRTPRDVDTLGRKTGQGSRSGNDSFGRFFNQLAVGIIAGVLGQGGPFQSECTSLSNVRVVLDR